jgi:putative phosphoribosyl transferase
MNGKDQVFQDRTDAGRQLAQRLIRYKEENPLVLGLPRGGVVVGHEVAAALGAPLDVLVARKLGAPMQPELGIGAVAPGGVLLLDDPVIGYLGISPVQIDRIVEQEQAEMERRLRLYRGDRPPPRLEDRMVILVDDGLATGVTARAAVQSVRQRHPAKIVLGVPVCAAETAHLFRELVDELTCVHTVSDFRAVGCWYHDFDQTSDEEVIRLLHPSLKEPGFE